MSTMLKHHLIRRLRHRLRMTQAALGDAIGQSQPYVSDLERGVRPVLAVATLDRLAQALGVPMEALLTAEERRRRAALGVPRERVVQRNGLGKRVQGTEEREQS